MKNRIKTIMIAAVSVLTLGAFTPTAEAGGCSVGGSRISINFGNRGHSSHNSHYNGRSSSYYTNGQSSHSGYHGGGYSRPTYRDTCSLVDTCYFNRGCYRYAKYTYMHRRIDCHGHVVRCWKTYKTVCVGRLH